MLLTTHGVPYVEVTDDVEDYPTTSLALANAIEALVAQHRVELHKAAAQAFADATLTLATFDTEDLDTDGFHESVVNPTRITIPAGLGGIYLVELGVELPNPATSHALVLWLRKNGADLSPLIANASVGNYGPGNHVPGALTASLKLAAGDYIEGVVTQQSGASRNSISQRFAATRLPIYY